MWKEGEEGTPSNWLPVAPISIMATSAANASISNPNGSGSKSAVSGQHQNKASFAAKMAEAARQSEDDGSAR